MPVPGLQPPTRYQPAVATGASHTFLYGGVADTGAVRNDFWRFDGAVWQPLPAGPGNRYGARIAVDPLRGEVVLFGGVVGSSPTDETWVFDGASWQLRQPATRPAPRAFASLGANPPQGTVWLHGGVDANHLTRSDTWSWDGSTWTMLAATGPSAFGDTPSLTYDTGRQLPVLVGRDTHGTQLLLYAWTPTGWQAMTLGNVALPNGGAIGLIAVGIGNRPGLWVLNTRQLFTLSDEEPSAQPLGTGCSAAAPSLHGNGWPRLGDGAFALELHGHPGGGVHALLTGFPGVSTPVLGCTLHVANGIATFVATDAVGRATVPLPIPLAGAFVGLQLASQLAALDPGTASGVTLSAGLQLQLGR